MSSLAFDALDRHVIAGRADAIAFAEGSTEVTYARLLERSAALGGGLLMVGVEAGSSVAVRLGEGLDHVVTVLALARVQVHVDDAADVRIEGTPVHVHVGGEAYEWATLAKAGAGDPAVAAPHDPPGYAERLRAAYPQLFETLLAGGTLSGS